MTIVATVVCNLVGAALVMVILRDILHELFHPGGSGSLSGLVQRNVWRLFRRAGRLKSAGPTVLTSVVITWGAVLALGWALIYWPYLGEYFRFTAPLSATSQSGFLDALYFSLVAVTTLGYGDITPTETLLRFLVTFEAAIGVGLLTAGITWILSLYPVLSRRRTLAQRTFVLARAQREVDLKLLDLDPTIAGSLIGQLASDLAQVRVDVQQSGISYYFHDGEHLLAMPLALPLLAGLADEAMAKGRAASIQLAGSCLHDTVRTYLDTIKTDHSNGEDLPLGELLAWYADDQCYEDVPPETRREPWANPAASSIPPIREF